MRGALHGSFALELDREDRQKMMEMGGVLRPGRSRSGVLVTIAAVVLTIALALSAPGPLREPGAALGPGGGPLVPTGYHRVPLDSNGVVASQSAIPNPLPTVYGNASFELPAFAGLAGYVNVTGADSAETNGAQVPIVSWTADGVFYVNLSNDLVFYNFATDTVTEIAAWTPLYEDLMDYNGMANTEYITQDGTEIYSIGCPTSCQSDPQPDVEVEVANVSTGQVWIYPFVGLTFSTVGGLGNTEKNVQPLLIGLNGSDTEAVIVDEEGVMYGVPVGSPASTPPRELTNLLFFEANNLDWMPSLNSFINEEAGGSLSDEWQQLLWNGQTVTDAMTGSWGAGIKSEFADAGGYNLTAGQWSLTAGNCSGRDVITGFIPIVGGVAGAFETSGVPDRVNSCPYAPPHPPLDPNGTLGVEGGGSDRVPITAAGPFVAEAWNNTSAILNPVTGEWSSLGAGANPGIYGPSATFSTANLFHNGSYLVSPRSGSCEITCSLRGEAGATNPGTEWWLWNMALPEFPYAPTSPLDEGSPPPAPVLTLTSTNDSSVTASWTESTSGGPLLNFTMCWTANTTPAVDSCAPLMPWADSYAVTGLTPGTDVAFSVFALNYHYFGPPATGAVSVRVDTPGATFLGQPVWEGYGLVAALAAGGVAAIWLTIQRWKSGHHPQRSAAGSVLRGFCGY